MLEVQPMPGHEVVKKALLVHGAPGRFKQLQRDGGFFFEVFYKMKARVHASTTERPILGLALDTIETTEIPAAIQRFLFAKGRKFARVDDLEQALTTTGTSHTHQCNREPDEEMLPVTSPQC